MRPAAPRPAKAKTSVKPAATVEEKITKQGAPKQPAARRFSKTEKLRGVAGSSDSASAAALGMLPDATGPPALADDLLYGAAAIAEFLFGSAEDRRRVYWLAEFGQLPTFNLGTTICARRSSILRAVELLERNAVELQ